MHINNNFREKLKKFFITNLDIIYFIIILSIKAFNFNKSISPTYFSYTFVGAAIISSMAILGSIALIFKNNTRTRLLYIFNIIISVIIIIDTVYYRYFKDVMSLGVVRNGFLLGGVGASVKELIHATDFLYLLDIFILIPLLSLYKKVDRPKLSFIKRFVIFIIIFGISISVNAKKIYDLSVDQPRLISTMFNRIYLTQILGPIDFHVLDTYNVLSTSISNMKRLPVEQQNEIKTYLEKKNTSTAAKNFTGAGKGKNLLVIQVEALQQFVINKKINGQEITPNLNRWINKSMYFNNYFYQVAAGNTSDAEFLSNNSLYPAASGAAYYMYSSDNYSSLAKEMDDKNYYTAALHGYKEGFWNRNVMYKAEKFNDFYGERTYNINENVGLGLSDKSFLNQTFDKLKTFSQPYFAFTITLSSHYPYDDVNGYTKGTTGEQLNTGKYENTLFGDYLKGIHYTDQQLGMFLDKLESSGMMNNTIVMLYGDHYAIPKNEMPSLYDFEGIKNPTDLDWYELQKVPMFIHFPEDANKGVNDLYTGQIDLFPTIANLYNLPNKYMLGKDMLNSTKGDVKFRNGSFTDGNNFYVSWTNTYYDIKTKKVIPSTPALEAEKNTTLTELQYSDDILNHNLLKKFMQEDSESSKSNK